MVSEDSQGRITKKVCLSCNREYTGIVASCPHDGTVLIPLAQDQLIGTKLADRYEILSVVGHGGMGVVYKARHDLMDRIVAIKMLQAQLISDSMSVKRFQQEAKAASRLKHPNVITLYDFGVSPTGQPYLVMDFLEGTSLADVIKKDGQVGVDRCLKIFSQACDALDHAHRQGVIHRDLKPGNIMLIEAEGDKDFVKVVDFGVAKLLAGSGEDFQRLTQTGEVCGSPVYMSPEQCRGEKLDARSDIYSMGVVVYESLTGKLPLLGKNMVDTMSKHITDMPLPFGKVRTDLYIPERLEKVVFTALQKSQASRYQSMEAFGKDILQSVPRTSKVPTSRTHLPDTADINFTAHAVKTVLSTPFIAIASTAAIFLALLILWISLTTHQAPTKWSIPYIKAPSTTTAPPRSQLAPTIKLPAQNPVNQKMPTEVQSTKTDASNKILRPKLHSSSQHAVKKNRPRIPPEDPFETLKQSRSY